MAVIACPNDKGTISDNIQDDAVIANEIPSSTFISSNGLIFILLNKATPSAILCRLYEIIENIAAINIAVSACPSDKGTISDNIQDDAVIAVDIATNVLVN
jgi:uncharacterized protein YbaR (Trm112 family)